MPYTNAQALSCFGQGDPLCPRARDTIFAQKTLLCFALAFDVESR
jgi:hypothetical protein